MSPSKSSPTTSTELGADRPLLGLPGVGPRTAARLAELGLERLEDVLLFSPRRYDDAGALRSISSLVPGDRAYVEGEVRTAAVRRFFRRATLEVRIADESGELILRWFRFRGQVPERFALGRRVRAAGLVRRGKRGLELIQPVAEEVGEVGAALRPRYALPRGVSSHLLAGLATLAARAAPPEPMAVPSELPNLTETARAIHALPPLPEAAQRVQLANGRAPAHRRVAFEELLLVRLHARRSTVDEAGIAIAAAADPARGLAKMLAAAPFSPTAAQRRTVAEIAADLAEGRPMRRLLTGDVGSGKTWVAAAALELCCASGHRGVLLAPTSLLAEQQAATLTKLLAPTGRRIALLHAGIPRKQRGEIERALADPAGAFDVVVGTQALLDEALQIARLALVVVDEQQRFGVVARAALVEHARRVGPTPHQLALSATPIPRSLALALRGQLALTHLDERPPGRRPIATDALFEPDAIERAVELARAAMAAGEQVYWICPQIDEGEGARGVLEVARAWTELIGDGVLSCHGRQTPNERGRQMAAFRAGAGLLVATTVVEVGLDVPGATTIVIEAPTRLGLSQLHQLRGRVGRGERPGRCLLVAPRATDLERDRLSVMVRLTEGLAIAEVDLERRGMGDLFGVAQSGLPSLPPLDPEELARLVEAADEAASEILKHDPELSLPGHVRLRRALERRLQTQVASRRYSGLSIS